MRRNAAPTKTNLINLKRELSFALQGYELLDQKRNILIIELLSLVDRAVDMQAQVEHSLSEAFARLQQTVIMEGKLATSHLASAVNITSELTITERRVMGVTLPQVDTNVTAAPPYYSSLVAGLGVDETIERFRDALELIGKLAELKVSIVRLAREVKKTIRKVNALEKIAIPDLRETVKLVQERLEESERDMFALMKMVKARLEQRREVSQ